MEFLIVKDGLTSTARLTMGQAPFFCEAVVLNLCLVKASDAGPARLTPSGLITVLLCRLILLPPPLSSDLSDTASLHGHSAQPGEKRSQRRRKRHGVNPASSRAADDTVRFNKPAAFREPTDHGLVLVLHSSSMHTVDAKYFTFADVTKVILL